MYAPDIFLAIQCREQVMSHGKRLLSTTKLLRYHLEHYGGQYIDQNPNLPTPSEEALNTSAERLIMTSTPYQMLLMKIRHIYRWDNPTETAKYLAAYTFLWTIDYLSGAAVGPYCNHQDDSAELDVRSSLLFGPSSSAACTRPHLKISVARSSALKMWR